MFTCMTINHLRSFGIGLAVVGGVMALILFAYFAISLSATPPDTEPRAKSTVPPNDADHSEKEI